MPVQPKCTRVDRTAYGQQSWLYASERVRSACCLWRKELLLTTAGERHRASHKRDRLKHSHAATETHMRGNTSSCCPCAPAYSSPVLVDFTWLGNPPENASRSKGSRFGYSLFGSGFASATARSVAFSVDTGGTIGAGP